MKLKSNIIDPYVGQEAEGKKIKFEFGCVKKFIKISIAAY